ncbi:hypothetical protein [Caballeronia sp. SBC1]|uniref:hypothetical protein n=1 Tax=Caballeronia sp. SBC1 TaxID=2705548 RepID=UPI00140B8C5D|nr:hypothetical protein [Caballeronia sp. SBC1]
MKKLLLVLAAAPLSLSAFATTYTPLSVLSPFGSLAGQVIASTGPTTAPAWTTVTLSGLGGLAKANNLSDVTSTATALSNLGGLSTTTAASTYATITNLALKAALAGSTSQAFSVANATAGTQAEALGQSLTSGTVQTETGSRALSTTYTNSTAHPIFVYATVITSSAVATTLQATVSGIVIGLSNTSAAQASIAVAIGFIVPAGATYGVALNAGAATLNNWSEVR